MAGRISVRAPGSEVVSAFDRVSRCLRNSIRIVFARSRARLPGRVAIGSSRSSITFACDTATRSLLTTGDHFARSSPLDAASSISRCCSRTSTSPFSTRIPNSSDVVIASTAIAACRARCSAFVEASARSANNARPAGVAGLAFSKSASARAIFAVPAFSLESDRPIVTSSAAPCAGRAARSAVPSVVHASVNFVSNSVSAPVTSTTACFRGVSLSAFRWNSSFAFRAVFASWSAFSASARTLSFSARSPSSVCNRRSSNPEAVIVTCNGRDSPLFPFKSVATSFIVSRSPGFTPIASKSHRVSIRVFLPGFFKSTVSFHPPSFTFTTCETFARPKSSLALAATSTSSFAGKMRSLFGFSSSTDGTRSGSARSSFSGLNLFSNPVSAATRCTR